MRLLMISQDFPPETGGIQTYAAAHASALAEMCEWFGVIAPSATADRPADQELSYPVIRLQSPNELLLLPLLFHLPHVLQLHDVEAVFHTQWQTLPASLKARREGWNGSILVAAHLRELLLNPYHRVPLVSSLFVRYRKKVLESADHFYPVSDFTAERLIKLGVLADRMTVVANGTDPKQFFPGEECGLKDRLGLSGRRVLLTITRLVRRKGIDLVLSCLPDLVREFPDLHYLIVGEGEDRERLQALVRRYNLDPYVTFHGPVPHHQTRSFYSIGELFVMPSRTMVPDVEGAGIVFLEANACGLPVIGSDSGGIPSVIRDGETGYIVAEGDCEALGARIRELMLVPERARKFGRAGRVRVKDLFNWERCSRELFDSFLVETGKKSRKPVS